MRYVKFPVFLLVLFSQIAGADTRPDAHAPIGVMAEHTHKAGEVMFSYRYMHMVMRDNRDNTSDLSKSEIVSNTPNRFFGMPMQPPTLRVVPTRMETRMHMVGAMYAPNDWLTLMGMVNYVEKSMEHVTYAGMAGTTPLGKFTTSAAGLGDSSVSGLFRLGGTGNAQWIGNLGVSIPTGDTDETDQVLAPNGMRPTLRLPYPMQLGSGTWDPILGITHSNHSGDYGWGAQWRGVLRTEKNDEGYSLGDEHKLTGWISRTWCPRISTSLRLAYLDRGNVDGIDPKIVAPVQTANPDFQGAERIDLGLGANFLLPGEKHRIALEANLPIHQDLDGPQMKMDWGLTLGFQWVL